MPPLLIAPAIGALAGGLAFGSVTAAVIGGLVGAGSVLAMNALAPSANMASPTYAANKPQATASTIYPVPIVFGSVGMAGNIIQSTAPGGEDREIVIALGEGPMNGVARFQYNNKDYDQIGETGKAAAVVVFQDGSEDQTAPSADYFPDIHAAGDVQNYRRTAALYFRFVGKSFTQSGQQPLMTVEGLTCWDLITHSTRSFSRNPAKIAATYLNQFNGVDWSEIDLTAFQALETLCDAYAASEGEEWSEDLMGAGMATASNTHSEQFKYAPSNVLSETEAPWITAEGTIDAWIQYDFGEGCAVRIAKYRIEVQSAGDRPISWTFKGSNNGTDWITLDTQSSYSWASPWSADIDIDSDSVDRYRYYRIHATASSHNQIGILRWKMYAKLGQISRRFCFDYCLDTFRSIVDFEKDLGRSFFGKLTEDNGFWKPVYLHYATSSIFDFTKSNIQQGSFSAGTDEIPNVVRITYRNRARDFTQDTVEARDDDDIAERGEVVYSESCDFITDREAALRRCQFVFDLKRYCPGWCKFASGQWASAVEEYDVVSVTHPLCARSGGLYFVEEKKEDEYGRPSFTLRDYSASLFHDRTAPNDPPIGDQTSSIMSIRVPETPVLLAEGSGAGTGSIPGGSQFAWSNTGPANRYLIEVDIKNQGETLESGWGSSIEISGTSYSHYLTDDQVSTYGADAKISARVRSLSPYGVESPVSAVETVTALPKGGVKLFAAEGDGTGNAVTLSAFKAQTTRLFANGRYWTRRCAETEIPDLWDFQEVGTNQVQPRSGYRFEIGEPVIVEYVPA